MLEENSVSQQEEVNDGIDYIEALKDMKQNSVSKDKYLKLKEENSKLVKALVDGGSIEQPAPEIDVDAAAELAFKNDHNISNLDRMKNYLAYRDAVLEKFGKDVLLPYGPKAVVTQKDIDDANTFVTIMQECIDIADGDSDAFTAALQRRMTESPTPKIKKR